MDWYQRRAKDLVQRESGVDLYSRRMDFLFGNDARYNECHDDQGEFCSDGDGGSGGSSGSSKSEPAEKSTAKKSEAKSSSGSESDSKDSASALFDEHNDPSATAESVVASTEGAKEAIEKVTKQLAEGVHTNAPVAQGGFIKPDGTYTDERQALHQKILEEELTPERIRAATPAEGVKPTLSVLGGRGGSGKSFFTQEKIADPAKAIYLNSDDIQEKLPGYAGWNAAFYHEEASDIVAKADEIVRGLGVNVIHDATMRSVKGATARIDDYKRAGYRIEGHYMFLPPQTSTKRGLERFMRGKGIKGRYVPPEYLIGSVTNERTFDGLKAKLDRWTIYQNMGKSPKLVAESGG